MTPREKPKFTPNEPLDFKDWAPIAGIKVSSARAYHSGAKFRRKKAAETGDTTLVRPGDLPEPDGHKGQSPVWRYRTILRWMATRPGQGVYSGPHGRQKKVAESA